jgi:putative ABC transport system ATP-binding protein
MSIDATVTVDSVIVEHQTSSGPVRALDGVTFSVASGSSVAITGPSGGGKSTLLGVIGGLAQPTSGSVRIGDSPISELSERDRSDFRRTHMGFVYQADNLLPFLTLLEMWAFSFHERTAFWNRKIACDARQSWSRWFGVPTA